MASAREAVVRACQLAAVTEIVNRPMETSLAGSVGDATLLGR